MFSICSLKLTAAIPPPFFLIRSSLDVSTAAHIQDSPARFSGRLEIRTRTCLQEYKAPLAHEGFDVGKEIFLVLHQQASAFGGFPGGAFFNHGDSSI